MAVAWIGNRETLVERAVEHAAALLHSSRCPVFSFDTDIHGTRAAIALAALCGAAYDHIDGAALARETALFTDKGGMFTSPGETRRRADIVVVVGKLPEAHLAFVAELAETVGDLSASNARQFFVIGDGRMKELDAKQKATRLSCGNSGLAGTLAALRAQLAGRQVASKVSNFDRFASALTTARYAVFLFSGLGCDELAAEMLQGLVADLNRTSRAAALHLPSSDSGWGSMLTSTWSTGFALRTSFAPGFPVFDPWRFDVQRATSEGEADLRLWVCANPKRRPATSNGLAQIALAKTARPVADAAVTIAIGEAGVDHDAVVFSARVGSLSSIEARSASSLPPAAAILRSIADHIPARTAVGS
jgi:formylmethanofuran dehydrogenase subunit B